MIDQKLHDFIIKMPKVELHLHLEGSIRPETAMALMKRNRVNPLPKKAEQVRNLYRFEDLAGFVEGMRTVSNNIRYLQDLSRIATELLEILAKENVRYVEFDCAVQKYLMLGFQLEDVIAAIDRSVQEAQSRHRLQARLTINLQRSLGVESAIDLVEAIADLDHPLVVGVGLSGDEGKYEQALFRRAFDRAAELGLHRTAHAGEAVGPESVWSAINDLGVERIDHGTRAREDEELVQYLIEKQIPLTQCLTSNLKLKVVDSIQDHPFGDFYRLGIVVTLNTDDPQVFGTQLNDEYLLAADAFKLDETDLSRIVLNGVQAAFLKDSDKEILMRQIRDELQHLQDGSVRVQG
ncbi:adenosine deaminase [candidate division KSB1 bacterium]|nr:adenosine deaminase [candidate division KSB1 bacterium]